MFALRPIIAVLMVLMLSACTTTGDPSPTPTTITILLTSTTTNPTTTALTEPAPETCDPPAFLPTVLPERVVDDQPDLAAVPLDEFTLQPGTIVTGWTDENGNPVLAMVRGGLPPIRWLAPPERIEVREFEAAVGDLGDGIWGVAWVEGPDRCDEFYLVFYPPTGPEEAKVVVASLTG